ncbi:hypothetical protein evm_003908 [Chilo suppressalis]|nr:hypothetical protein evm_003908 [Chilo suppressalis]
MTEGPTAQHDRPMCVRIWLEVGHACEPRSSSLGRALALDWRLWVRGASGRDISSFVHKVVFYLHPANAFVYPKRVLQEPPYEIQESGSVSIDIPIHVYLKHSNKPKKIRLRYSLVIEHEAKSSGESRRIYYDVENPSEQLWQALMSGGGEVVARTTADHHGDRLVVLPDSRPRALPRRHKFVEPLHCKHAPRKATKPYVLDETCCTKCGESQLELKKQLRSVTMTQDEIHRVTQLYLAFTGYEKTVDALKLPPLSDSIYKLPELPASLREALKATEMEFTPRS